MKRGIPLMRFVLVLLLFFGFDSILRTSEANTYLKQSSYELMSSEVRAMQDDPSLNPATFWLLDGQALWRSKQGREKLACADCHGDSGESMKGVAATFPKIMGGGLRTLEGQINFCRLNRQKAAEFAYETKELLSLSAFIASFSKGYPILVEENKAVTPFLDNGRRRFNQRIGQLNLSCAQCHQDRPGLRLGGNLIPQGHPNAYPIYRLEWQSMGSLQRRIRNCLSGVRAQLFEYGSQELAEIELFLMWRARGMVMESPGVRP